MTPDVAWLVNMIGLFIGFCVVVGVLVWLAVSYGRAKAREKIRIESDEEVRRAIEESGKVDLDLTTYTDDQLNDEL